MDFQVLWDQKLRELFSKDFEISSFAFELVPVVLRWHLNFQNNISFCYE